MTGEGYLKCYNGKSYEGTFLDGELNGDGRFFVEGATYSL